MFVLVWRSPPDGVKVVECPVCDMQIQFRYNAPFQCRNCSSFLANFEDLLESRAERAIYHFRGREALLDGYEE